MSVVCDVRDNVRILSLSKLADATVAGEENDPARGCVCGGGGGGSAYTSTGRQAAQPNGRPGHEIARERGECALTGLPLAQRSAHRASTFPATHEWNSAN